MKPDIVSKIAQAGLEFMGCYRAADEICYFLGGLVENKDYGDKTGYRMLAWKEEAGKQDIQHAATLLFFISKSAMAEKRRRLLFEAEPALLKQLALANLKRMLDEGISEREIVLVSSSPDGAFQVDDPSGDPLIAQRRLRDEILRLLALRHANGERRIRFETIRDRLCASEDWIQHAFRLLAKKKLVEGLEGGNLRLTDDGHLAAETIVPITPPVSGASIPLIGTRTEPSGCFVSYAGEDRGVVNQLVNALTTRNVQVWWDKGEITLGDRLSQKIEEGLRLSRYGLVLISQHFVAKKWPQAELRALHARAMTSGQKVILPVLVGMKREEFAEAYPLLADLVTTEFTGDIDALADEILRAMK